jgi:hypothetical protein
MRNQGWKFVNIAGSKYQFEKCQPEDWIYQLDFQNKNTEKSSYINLFNDYGWEYVLQHDNWFYFRRKKDTTDVDISIFSDKDSNIAMCERVLNGKLLVNVSLFLISCVIVILSVFTKTFSAADTVLIPNFTWINYFVKAALPWVGIGLLVATSYSFSDYKKIKSKINVMKNPLE